MILGLLLGLGVANAAPEPPICEASVRPLPAEHLAVAWVAPLGRRAGPRTWLTVFPVGRLRAVIEADALDLGRLLQVLGLRKRSNTPRRGWGVTIFEVDTSQLCRPMFEGIPGDDHAGVDVCPRNHKGIDGRYEGCGYTTDRATGDPGLDVFSIQWRDAAARGFCVLPAERFLAGE